MAGEPGERARQEPPIGVLLTNLGTPEAPTVRAVRRYLAEFLADPRVVEAPRWAWLALLHGVILRVRPRRSAAAYAKVWTERGSPLLAISRDQREALAAVLEAAGPGRYRVALAMRYGRPAIAEVLAELLEGGVRRLLVLPLYPQYSATTTASTFDALAAALAGHRRLPDLRFVAGYHDHRPYIEALAASVEERWRAGGRGERLLLSFHGLPERYRRAGDPYYDQCLATARLLGERLGLGEDGLTVSFQSRVGREAWLRPYTDELLLEWARQGIGRVQVLCPGFAADCLETLEEIAEQNAEAFTAAGGGRLEYIPALNARRDHIAALAALVEAHCAGWPQAGGGR